MSQKAAVGREPILHCGRKKKSKIQIWSIYAHGIQSEMNTARDTNINLQVKAGFWMLQYQLDQWSRLLEHPRMEQEMKLQVKLSCQNYQINIS